MFTYQDIMYISDLHGKTLWQNDELVKNKSDLSVYDLCNSYQKLKLNKYSYYNECYLNLTEKSKNRIKLVKDKILIVLKNNKGFITEGLLVYSKKDDDKEPLELDLIDFYVDTREFVIYKSLSGKQQSSNNRS